MTTKDRDLLSSCYLPIYSFIEKKPLKSKNQEKFKQYLLLKSMSILYMVIVSYERKKIDGKEKRQSHKQYNDTQLGWGEK